jgi:RHS repeat-associated protein
LEDIASSVAGQQHAGFTFPTSTPWYMVAGVFKAAGGATVPGAPTNLSATGGMGQAKVSWTAPASNGGSAITYYTVTSSPGGFTAQTANGSTTNATVTGLTNGTAYTFIVTATNSVGTGPASAASNAVTTGITIRTYYYANGSRIATAVNGVFSYLASDGLGSADVTLDSSGNLIASTLFAPYGGVRYAIGIASTDFGFTGQHADTSTGLDYYGARYYDPVAGQFTSADTVQPGGGYDVWGLSRYAYVEGNPVIRTDPSGHLQVCADDPTCGDAYGSGGPTGHANGKPISSSPAPSKSPGSPAEAPSNNSSGSAVDSSGSPVDSLGQLQLGQGSLTTTSPRDPNYWSNVLYARDRGKRLSPDEREAWDNYLNKRPFDPKAWKRARQKVIFNEKHGWNDYGTERVDPQRNVRKRQSNFQDVPVEPSYGFGPITPDETQIVTDITLGAIIGLILALLVGTAAAA